jgi:hypothetical protein
MAFVFWEPAIHDLLRQEENERGTHEGTLCHTGLWEISASNWNNRTRNSTKKTKHLCFLFARGFLSCSSFFLSSD